MRRIPAILVCSLGVLLAAAAVASSEPDDPIRVVSIGDSFIAGNGNTNYYSGQGPNQTDVGGPRVPAPGRNCFQSYSSYPWQFVQRLNDSGSPAAIWHVACGGAWTYDIIPQWDTVPGDWKSDADIVLISAGGNDAGFADVVWHCVAGLPGDSTCDAALDNAEAQLPGILDRLEDRAREIAEEAPGADVAFVGYPYLTSPTKQRCASRGEWRLRQLQQSFDQGLSAIAGDLNAEFSDDRFHAVEVAPAFLGRGPCAWHRPLMHDYFAADGERFHPNWEGANTIANVLFNQDIHEEL